MKKLRCKKGLKSAFSMYFVSVIAVVLVSQPVDARNGRRHGHGPVKGLERCAPDYGGPYSEFIGSGAYECRSDVVPKTALGRKLDQCMSYFFAGYDVYEECFTEDFTASGPESMWEPYFTPGRETYDNYQAGAMYDTWFWKEIRFRPTSFIQQGNTFFQVQYWEAQGPKTADLGTPWCPEEVVPGEGCPGYGRPLEDLSEEFISFPLCFKIEMRRGKIASWTLYADQITPTRLITKDDDFTKVVEAIKMMLIMGGMVPPEPPPMP